MTSQAERQNGWKALLNSLANSGITGLSRAGSESTVILKLFWLLLFVAGVIGFSVNFSKIFIQLQQEPVLTQIKHEYTAFTWPHITLCHPSNPIAFWKKPSLKQLWERYHRNATRMKRIIIAKMNIRMPVEEMILASVDRNTFFSIGARGSVFLLHLRYQITEKIAVHSRNYRSFKKLSQFDSGFHDHLITLKSPMPCYTLKPEFLSGPKLAKVNGIRMYLILDSESDRFLKIPRPNYFYLYINNPNHTNTNSYVYSISSGASRFQISESKFTGVKDCRHRDYMVEIYDSLMQKSYQLLGTYDDCRYKLSQSLFYERCGCYNPSIPIYKLDESVPRLCLNMTLYNATEIISNYRCIKNVKKEYDRGNTFESLLNKECGAFVKPKCDRTTYSIDLERKSWTKKGNLNFRRKTIDFAMKLPNFDNSIGRDPETFLLDNLASVDFQRKKENVSLAFEEWEYTLPKFLSDVGGLLGLWLGLSCIGAFELVDLIVRILILAITSTRNKV